MEKGAPTRVSLKTVLICGISPLPNSDMAFLSTFNQFFFCSVKSIALVTYRCCIRNSCCVFLKCFYLTCTRLFELYPLINRKTPLKHKCTTLLYKWLTRPIITNPSTVRFGTSNKNFNKLQRLQNEILRISLNAPWFIRNTQIHRETPTIKDLITTLTLNFHLRQVPSLITLDRPQFTYVWNHDYHKTYYTYNTIIITI